MLDEKEKLVLEYIDPKKLVPSEYSRKLFPPLQGDAYEYLKTDIEENGIRTPLEVNKNNIILCGHERQRVALELGLKEVPIIRFGNGSESSEVEEKIHLIKDNLARKAVDEETGCECAVELDILYGLKAGRPKITPEGVISDVLSQEKVAEKYNVSRRRLQRGKRIKLSNLPEEIKHSAFHGPLTLRSVDSLLSKPQEVQDIAIPRIVEALRNDGEGISIEKMTAEISEELELDKELETIGVPPVKEQVKQFYEKIKAYPPKHVNKTDVTTKNIVRSVLLLMNKNNLVCPVCGEKHIQWKCGHEFQ